VVCLLIVPYKETVNINCRVLVRRELDRRLKLRPSLEIHDVVSRMIATSVVPFFPFVTYRVKLLYEKCYAATSIATRRGRESISISEKLYSVKLDNMFYQIVSISGLITIMIFFFCGSLRILRHVLEIHCEYLIKR
jgi:hypothetical protein